ncbi:MAG: glycosyltransferase family 2 protein, partial [Cyanobacteria bacterium]|nr:glycosyltransferase family 2 protein [Cyanobacteriota bacterium]
MIEAPTRILETRLVDRSSDAGSKKFCAVIPVYNSAGIIRNTIARTEEAFEKEGLNYEIVVVNDCSHDTSWQILAALAAKNPRITAIDLVRNAGQHAALICGIQNSDADYYITLDDDLQNPPEEIVNLVEKALDGYDFVCGRFHQKKHSLYRRLGSRLIHLMNERIFAKPKDYALTNFRIIERSLAERIVAYRTPYPYISGLAISLAANPGNVDVEHHERAQGKSNYSLTKILKLVLTILFNYSSFPLRVLCGVGVAVSTFSFTLGAFFMIQSLCRHVSVPGW